MQNNTIETLYMFDVKEIWAYIDSTLPVLMQTNHITKSIESVVYDMMYEVVESVLFTFTNRHYVPRYDYHDPAISAICDQLKPWIQVELVNLLQSHGVVFGNVHYTDFIFSRTAFILVINRHHVGF